MATVEIKGVGKVEVDDSFLDMPADEQDRTIREIVGQVSKPKDTPAPASPAPFAPPAPPRPNVKPSPDAKSAISALFPNARITDWKRDPNSALGRANPDSWHNRSAAAIDMAPIPGMTYEEAKAKIEASGYTLIEDIDEVKHPSGHATGPHWHFVLGGGPEAAPPGNSPEEEQVYQDGLDQGFPKQEQRNASRPLQDLGTDYSLSGIGKSLAAGAGAVVEGIADIPALIGNPLNAAINYGFGTNLSTDLGGTLRDDVLGIPRGNETVGAINRGVAGGAAFSGAARLGAKAATGATEYLLSKLASTPVGDAVSGGTAALAGEGAKQAGLGPTGQMIASLAGGAVGGGASIVAPERIATNPQRWAAREADRNLYSKYDAEVVADLQAATKEGVKSDPKGRAKLTAKTINSVETGYTAEFKNIINGMDIPEGEKLKLKEAITRKHSITDDELSALPKTVEGEAVAHAIRKVKRLRALTPELKRSNGILHTASNVADLIPGIPGIVGRGMRAAGRGLGDGEAARVNAADKLISKASGYEKLGEQVGPSGAREAKDALWAKVNDLASKKEAEAGKSKLDMSASDKSSANRRAKAVIAEEYEDITGKAASARRSTLSRAADKMNAGSSKALDNFDEALATPVPIPEPKAPTAKDRKAFRDQITDPAPDMRDILDPLATDAKLASRITSRNSAVAKLEQGLTSFDEKLATPLPVAPVKTKAVDPAQAAIDDAVGQGIKGDSGVQNAFASRLGLSVPDMLKTLDHISKDVPELASEIARIKMGYPTKSRTMGSVLAPRMAKARDELGLTAPAKSLPVDEAAQASLAAKMDTPSAGKPAVVASKQEEALLAELEQIDPVVTELADGQSARASEVYPDQVTPEVTQRTAEIQEELRRYRRIDRKENYKLGTEANKAMANRAIEAMNNDITMGNDTMRVLARMPEKIRDGFKFTKDATDYIEDTLVPDMIAEGIPNSEIDKARRYLYEIADAKTHKTKEEFDEALKVLPRGRPRKPN